MAGGRNIKYMRRDCINAVDQFLTAVKDNLPYAAVHTDGVYYSNRNKFLDSAEKEKRSKGDRGTRLGIVFGGGDRDVTSYMFHMRDLSDPENAKAKSLRYTPERGKPAILAARSFPDGTIGEIDQLDASDLIRSTSQMLNSISFDAMFQGWGEAILANTEEERSVQRIADAGEAGGWDALQVKLSGPDPMDAMSAWGYIGLLAQNEDPDSPIMQDMAYRAMGLDALYDALTDVNNRISSDPDYIPDLAEYLDPDSGPGRRALRGLACMSAYKEARDHGGIDVMDDAGKHIIGIDLDNPRTAQVYDRLVNTRPYAELYQASLDRAEQSRAGIAPFACVQSTFAGIAKETDKAPDVRVDNSMLYRFYRCIMLGEDPDMPSGAPDLELSVADHVEDLGRMSANDILIDSRDLPKGMGGMPFGAAVSKAMSDPDGSYGKLFSKFPAMDYYMSLPGGSRSLEQLAITKLQSSDGKDIDGLVLETSIFEKEKKKLCALTRNNLSAGQMGAQFVQNFVDTHKRSPQLLRSLDASIAMPDFSRGVSKFGQCVILDLKDSGDLIYPGWARGEGGNNATRTARAFRKADAERTAACSLYARSTGLPAGTMPQAGAYLSERGGTGIFNKFMDACYEIGQEDPVKAAMMQNDFIVLSDCYKIKSESGLAKLSVDVQGVYSGDAPGQSLYRPKSRAEASALGAIYDSHGYDWKNAAVPDMLQDSPDGFLQAAWRGAEGQTHGVLPGSKKLEAFALDSDTLDDAKYYNLIERLNGPPKSIKMLMLERRQAGQHRSQAQHGIETIDAEMED